MFYHIRSEIFKDLDRFRVPECRFTLEKYLCEINEVIPDWLESPENLSKVKFLQVAMLPDGTKILFADDKQGVLYRSIDGNVDRWVVLSVGCSDVSSHDRWFLTLEDAFLQSGNWKGRFPDNYEVS